MNLDLSLLKFLKFIIRIWERSQYYFKFSDKPSNSEALPFSLNGLFAFPISFVDHLVGDCLQYIDKRSIEQLPWKIF